ncbi:MAG: ABC transporter permease [Alphaproteobacteria bacterium]|nr:ABC transporter permease [Alphaproteobacteria bacterium]
MSAAARVAARNRRAVLMMAVPALVVIAALIVVPYVNIVVMSFRIPSTSKLYLDGYTLGNYAKALTDPDGFYFDLLYDTLRLALTITIGCLVIAYPVAFHLARTTSKWRGVLYGLVLSPLLVSVVIRTYGWIILLGNNGLINQVRALIELPPLQLMYNEFGVVLALIHVFLPFMILPIMGAVQGIDPRLEEAARSLGAGRTKVFLRVLLPLSMPGIQSGCVLVFILGCGAYVTPALLGAGRVHTITTEVITLLDQFLWPFGAALALLLSLVGLAAVAIYAWLAGRLMRGIA